MLDDERKTKSPLLKYHSPTKKDPRSHVSASYFLKKRRRREGWRLHTISFSDRLVALKNVCFALPKVCSTRSFDEGQTSSSQMTANAKRLPTPSSSSFFSERLELAHRFVHGFHHQRFSSSKSGSWRRSELCGGSWHKKPFAHSPVESFEVTVSASSFSAGYS